jgi:hypothetical protein
MKTISRILPVLAIFVFLSCKTQPTSPETATIKGQVLLASDLDYNPTPPYNGIQVTLEGTNFSAMTDDSGLFELEGVPEGTYNVRFSKAGYGDVRLIGQSIQGGGNSPIYLNERQVWHNVVIPTLYKLSDLVTTLISASVKDTSIAISPGLMNYLWLNGQYSVSASQNLHAYQIAVYFSHQSDVSAEPGHYVWFQCWGTGSWWPYDTLARSFQLPISPYDLKAAGFNSGDSVYIATYGAPYWGQTPYYDYYDPSLRQGVLTSINQTPSPVIGLKIP